MQRSNICRLYYVLPPNVRGKVWKYDQRNWKIYYKLMWKHNHPKRVAKIPPSQLETIET